LRIMDEAQSLAYSSHVSHGGKIDLLGLHAAISLTFVERGILKNLKRTPVLADRMRYCLNSAAENAGKMLDVSVELGFGPSRIVAEFLIWRISIVAKHIGHAIPDFDTNNVAQPARTAKKAEKIGAESIKHAIQTMAKNYPF